MRTFSLIFALLASIIIIAVIRYFLRLIILDCIHHYQYRHVQEAQGGSAPQPSQEEQNV